MSVKKQFFLLLFFIFLVNIFAQQKQADKFYDNYDYLGAIPLYEKVLKKEPKNVKALVNLASCYRITKKYLPAEDVYQKVITLDSTNAMLHFYYGQMLRTNNKNEEARKQFLIYSRQVPGDKLGELNLRSMEDAKALSSRAPQYEVSNIKALNTGKAEFGAVYYGKGIVYSGEQQSNLLNVEDNKFNNQGDLNILFSEVRTEGLNKIYGQPKSFSEFNTLTNDGPACFSADGKTVFFNRIEDKHSSDKNFINRMKLFSARISGKDKWSKPEPFYLNSDAYSVMYPTLSADGKTLFFTSDMPGGLGGKDIYMCRKEGEKWGPAENMGPEINTSGNEEFAFLRQDGILFFSSDTRPGFGGLDIFSAEKVNGKWSNVVNMGTPLNSPADDFAIVFNDNYNGLLSSNRVGGSGGDDLYSFVLTGKLVTFKGKILLSQNIKDESRNSRVLLVSEDGSLLKVGYTDSIGVFQFQNLPPDLKFMVKMDETDPAFVAKKKFYLANDKNEVVRVSIDNNEAGKYMFTSLPPDINTLTPLQLNETQLNITGTLLLGDKKSKPLANTKIELVNERGEVVATTTTNDLGTFLFTQLPSQENFLVRIADTEAKFDPSQKIILANKNGKQLLSATSDINGKFGFKLLLADNLTMSLMRVDETELKTWIRGKLLRADSSRKEIAGVKIKLQDSKGNIVATTTTDITGRFLFKKLQGDENYIVVIDEDDPTLAMVDKVLITDEKGNSTREINKKLGKFLYKMLPADENNLSALYVEDTRLQIVMKGKLISDDTKHKPLSGSKVNLLNEKGEIVQTVYTDEKGNFTFSYLPTSENYIVAMDEKDPQLAKMDGITMLDEKGNKVKEVKHDKSGSVHFTLLPSDQMAMSSVTIDETSLLVDLKGKLLAADGKTPLNRVKMNLVNSKGEVLETAYSDVNGNFIFSKLPNDETYLIKIDEADTRLNDMKKLVLADADGNLVKEIAVSDKRNFAYELLPADRQTMTGISDLDDTKLHIAMKGRIISGDGNKSPVSKVKITLMDGNGRVIQRTSSDKEGYFSFTNLPADENYLFAIDENDPGLAKFSKINLMDQRGKVLKEMVSAKKEDFHFKLLPQDMSAMSSLTIEDMQLHINMKGKLLGGAEGKPLANSKVNLVDAKGKVVQTVMTDANGNFIFTKLPADENFIMTIDAEDTKLAGLDIITVADEKGKAVKEILSAGKGNFKFEFLPSDKIAMATVTLQDATLRALKFKQRKVTDSIVVMQNIYFEVNDAKLQEDGKSILDKVAEVMKSNAELHVDLSAHTDSRATAVYNLALSQRRAESAYHYLVSKGISGARISQKGYGETRLINRCSDDVNCSDQEHALNRRMEFVFSKPRLKSLSQKKGI